MNDNKLRRKIAIEAARLLVRRQEQDLGRARIRAARQIRGWAKPDQFPSETEIRDEIERLSYVGQGDVRFDNLRELRLVALQFARKLHRIGPRIGGVVIEGNVRHVASIELFIPHAEPASIEQVLPEVSFELIDASRMHAQLDGAIAIEISCGGSPDGPTVSLDDYEQLIQYEYPDLQPEDDLEVSAQLQDRFAVYRMLLAPLEQVHQRKSAHPEGDVLYHSLQVFELAREAQPYDEEFQLAALLHDVGKGIDPVDPARATRDALSGFITERTEGLIENLPDAHRILDNTIGSRARRRLIQHPDYEDLMLLARCDRQGRVPGGKAPTLDEALESIRELARMCGD